MEKAKSFTNTMKVSVPYRGATFLNNEVPDRIKSRVYRFRPLSGSYISQLSVGDAETPALTGFRPLSGSYISQYGPIEHIE